VPPKFLYFDLGKVLVDFDLEAMLCQMGAALGTDASRMRAALLGSGLQRRFELGQITSREVHAALCRELTSSVDYEGLNRAGCEIFWLNLPVLPIVGHLDQAGYRMGILSNTCANHWEYCLGKYRILRDAFDVYALSFRIGVCKPEAEIFRTAAELAGVAPGEIFYTDDTAEHVAGARAVGFDAVQFTGAEELAAELRQRGVRINY